ncbi:hypothetical protein TNCV_4840841 [Trichonephila clavipes]|nr:hypothetical protein TNCV_4840841 [Trichonephila clavipes]
MLPGSSTSLTALFHGCGSHLKTTGMCSRRHGEVDLEVTPAEDRYIVYQQKGTCAQSPAGGKISFLLPQESDFRKTVARRLRRGLYARRPVVCVPLTRQHHYCPFCNGVVKHHSGLNRTGHAYYSQMRVGSVCHRIVDAN